MCECVLTCCLIFTVVDFLSDGAQSNWLFDDVIVVRDLQTGGTERQTAVEFVCVCVCVRACVRACVRT